MEPEKFDQTDKDKLSNLAHAAGEKLEKGRVNAADTLESAAAAIRTKGGEAGATITDLSGKAATNLDTSARYVRNTSFGQVWSDVGVLARQHPGAIAVSAILAGYCMGRMMTRHSCCSRDQDA